VSLGQSFFHFVSLVADIFLTFFVTMNSTRDLQIGAAYQAHVRDGMDPSILGSSKEKSLKSQARKGRLNSIGGCPLRNDSQHAKYWKIFEV